MVNDFRKISRNEYSIRFNKGCFLIASGEYTDGSGDRGSVDDMYCLWCGDDYIMGVSYSINGDFIINGNQLWYIKSINGNEYVLNYDITKRKGKDVYLAFYENTGYAYCTTDINKAALSNKYNNMIYEPKYEVFKYNINNNKYIKGSIKFVPVQHRHYENSVYAYLGKKNISIF